MKTRTDVINELLAGLPATTRRYLEIGVRNPADNFDRIQASVKVGVDPAGPKGRPDILRTTSNRFFAKNTERFNVVFIDGDHRLRQVRKDVENAMKVADVVVLHDCLPRNESEGAPEKPAGGKPWCGEVWKVWYQIRKEGWPSTLYPFDHGVGVVRATSEPNPVNFLNWPTRPKLAQYLANLETWGGVVR